MQVTYEDIHDALLIGLDVPHAEKAVHECWTRLREHKSCTQCDYCHFCNSRFKYQYLDVGSSDLRSVYKDEL